jgi:hypothetical protein
MAFEVRRSIFRHGLAFYGTLSFVAAFFGARTFATLNPTIVVVNGGVHFHHFWYGLALVVASGWTGIALSDARIGRVLAIVFGLGAGLIGDEVGLLLTFGDYYSGLTEVFFVGAIGFIIVAMLLSRGRSRIEKDVFDISPKERLIQIGVFIAGFSTIFFAASNWVGGLATFAVGVLVLFRGLERRRKETSLHSLESGSTF